MPRYKEGNSPEGKREKVPEKQTYPTGKKMRKGSRLDCLGCKGKNPSCKGCDGKGYIVV